MHRREFLESLAIAGATGLLPSGGTFADDAPPPVAEVKAAFDTDAGRDVLQREINAVPGAVCGSYLRDEAAGRAACAKYPALARLDAALPRVMEEVRTAVVEDKPAEIRTEPKPWRGVDLNAPDVEAGLERAFANCNPRKDKILIVVANDSYAEYSVLRDFLKAREYDLRPIVGKEGTFVADQGGTNQKAE